jgi:hypothetical protein
VKYVAQMKTRGNTRRNLVANVAGKKELRNLARDMKEY